MEPVRVTLKDIANECGYSVNTVSRALRGDTKLSEQTRKKIQQTAKEKGFPYKDYLDGDFDIELEYDAVSMLKYAREYIKDTKLAELTGIQVQQLARYANEKTKPRPAQRRRIVEALRKFAAPLYAITL